MLGRDKLFVKFFSVLSDKWLGDELLFTFIQHNAFEFVMSFFSFIIDILYNTGGCPLRVCVCVTNFASNNNSPISSEMMDGF